MRDHSDTIRGGAVLPVPDASEATGVPAAAIRRYAERRILPPAAARGIDQGGCPQRLLPVLTTLRIMELVHCTPDQMRAVGATLTCRITSAATREEQGRLNRQLRTFQARLVEHGAGTRELSELTGQPPTSSR